MDLLSFPGKAIDKAEDFARYLLKTVPGLSLEKAEEIAKNAWHLGPVSAYDKAEEFAKHLWEAVPGDFFCNCLFQFYILTGAFLVKLLLKNKECRSLVVLKVITKPSNAFFL